MMNGRVAAENKAGGGAVFKVFLRLEKQSGRALDTAAEQRSEQQNLRLKQRISALGPAVLVADDNPVNQKVICLLMEKLNLFPDVVADGGAVLQKLRQKAYDLILMDVQMPGLDGFKTTRIIRDPNSDITQKKVPIIALTALAMPEDVDHCLKAGMDRVLTKPVHPEKLLHAIAGAMNL